MPKTPDKKSLQSEKASGDTVPFKTDMLSESQLIRTILNNSQDMIFFKDTESRFLFTSLAHARKFNIEDPQELIGKSDKDYYPPYFVENAMRDEQDVMRTRKPIVGRIERWQKDNGDVVWFSASKYPLLDDDGNLIGTWGTTRDITDLKNTEKELEFVNHEFEVLNNKLKELSVIDELSGLYNRRHFYDTLTKTMKIFSRVRGRGYSSTFSLVIMDIDNFKNVNDTYGHLVGDLAIKHVAELIKKNTRLSDYVFRYGGDEFAVILPDTDVKGSKELAERLRKIVEISPLQFNGTYLAMTLSLGTSTFQDQVDSMEIVQEADMKLYESKNKGRNCVS